MNNEWNDDEWKEWKRKIRSKKVAEATEKIKLPQGEPFVVLRTKEGKLAGREFASYETLYLLAEAISKRVWPDGSYEYVLPSVRSYFQMFCSDSKEGEQLRKAMASKKGWTPRFACREMILVDFGKGTIPPKDNVKELEIPLEGFMDSESLAQIGSSMVMKIPDRNESEWEPQPGRIVLYPNATEKPNRSGIENHEDLWFSKHDIIETSIDFSDALKTLIGARLLPESISPLIESGHVDRGNHSLNKGIKSYHLEVFVSSPKGCRSPWKEYSPNTFCVDTTPSATHCVALERIPRR